MDADLTWPVNYLLFSESLKAIDPAVANTVTELLLLPVENMLWRGNIAESIRVQNTLTTGYI